MESSSLKVTLLFRRFLLGLWISKLPSSIVSREMRLLCAVLNSVKFWGEIEYLCSVVTIRLQILQILDSTYQVIINKCARM